MRKSTLKNIRNHALEAYPAESCGLIIQEGKGEIYRPCRNLADGTDHFVMDPKDYAAAEAEGEILMIVHSHPNASAKPSEADKVMCEETGLPWLIVSVFIDLITKEMNAQDYTITRPSGYEAPLIGRVWGPPRLDCYSLIRDYYQRELDIHIPDFEVQKRATDWWNDPASSSLYLDHFSEAGFERVDDGPELHDVILMEVASKASVNHAGIYLGHDTGYMLHHLYGRLSNRVPYAASYWQDHTRMVVRHKDLK